MAKHKKITSAPISEALLDIKVILPKSFEVERLNKANEHLTNKYPIVENQKFFKGIHKIIDGKHQAITEDEGINGYLYKTDDRKDIVQFRRDGFTFNRLQPYPNWEYLIQETKELWPLYKQHTNPEAITRLAVRYINHIKIPLPINDFSEYLNVPPNIPDKLPQNVLNFLNRTTLNGFGDNIRANITQSLKSDSQNLKNQLVILLDVDVYKVIGSLISDDEIWGYFEKFRIIKNNIFFEYITEKTERLFK